MPCFTVWLCFVLLIFCNSVDCAFAGPSENKAAANRDLNDRYDLDNNIEMEIVSVVPLLSTSHRKECSESNAVVIIRFENRGKQTVFIRSYGQLMKGATEIVDSVLLPEHRVTQGLKNAPLGCDLAILKYSWVGPNTHTFSGTTCVPDRGMLIKPGAEDLIVVPISIPEERSLRTQRNIR